LGQRSQYFQVVATCPMLGNTAVLDPEDVDEMPLHCSPPRFNAGQGRKGRGLVRAVHGVNHHHLVTFGDDVLDRVSRVRKARDDSLENRLPRLTAARSTSCVVDEVLGQDESLAAIEQEYS